MLYFIPAHYGKARAPERDTVASIPLRLWIMLVRLHGLGQGDSYTEPNMTTCKLATCTNLPDSFTTILRSPFSPSQFDIAWLLTCHLPELKQALLEAASETHCALPPACSVVSKGHAPDLYRWTSPCIFVTEAQSGYHASRKQSAIASTRFSRSAHSNLKFEQQATAAHDRGPGVLVCRQVQQQLKAWHSFKSPTCSTNQTR